MRCLESHRHQIFFTQKTKLNPSLKRQSIDWQTVLPHAEAQAQQGRDRSGCFSASSYRDGGIGLANNHASGILNSKFRSSATFTSSPGFSEVAIGFCSSWRTHLP